MDIGRWQTLETGHTAQVTNRDGLISCVYHDPAKCSKCIGDEQQERDARPGAKWHKRRRKALQHG